MGDGVLATFGSASDAVRCAVALGTAVGPLGLDIHSGIHVGDVERRGEDIGGTAVNIASRVMESAGRCEVLVTSTTRDAAAGRGIRFSEAGSYELKGLREQYRLYRVSAALVVGGDDVGSVPLEQPDEVFGGVLHGDVAEHVGPVLVLPVDHARVVVPEQPQVRDTQRLARSLELAQPDAGDLVFVVALGSGLDPARCVAELAVRARDDDGSHAVVRVPRQDAAKLSSKPQLAA